MSTSGNTVTIVATPYGYVAGKTDALTQAEGYRQLKEIEAINGSHELRPSVTHLTADQLRQAEAAFKRLDGRPILAAVDWYLDTYRETLSKLTVAEA